MKLLEDTILIDNIKLHYYTTGKGPPLIFFHGTGSDALTYINLIMLLAEEYTVIFPDMPGYGKSGTNKTKWNFTEYAQFFKTFIVSKKLSNLTIMGHSLGGGTALHLALEINDPRIVDALILMDSGGIKVQASLFMLHLRILVFDNLFLRLQLKDIVILMHAMKRASMTLFRHLLQVPVIVGSAHKSVKEETPNLHLLAIKTLILWGENDQVFPISDAYSLQENIQNSQLMIYKGNHSWSLLFPEEAFHAIKQ